MAQCTLPILYLNLGGEMIYIIKQRLQAQDVHPEKIHRVMCDLVNQMLNEKCLIEIFKYQSLYSKKSLRNVFDKLAQSTIMKLSEESMDKLYDLMLMAVKYQVVLSRRPEEILLATLVHLDSMREFVFGSLEHVGMVVITHKKLVEFISPLTAGQYWHMRQRLLFFFQGMNKRVSVFLKRKAQVGAGRFVIPPIRPVSPHSEVPGSIRYFHKGELHLTHKFIPPMVYLPPQPLGSLDMDGDRKTLLGQNLYISTSEVETVSPSQDSLEDDKLREESAGSIELILLAQLVGTARRETGAVIRLSLFDEFSDSPDNIDGEETGKENEQRNGSAMKGYGPVIALDVKKPDSEKLFKLMEDFDIKKHDSGHKDDLFDLLEKTS